MRNARVVGYCMVILGALFISRAYSTTPPRWLLLGAGVLLIIGGVIRALRGRRAEPPAV